MPSVTTTFGTEKPPETGDALTALLRDSRRTAIEFTQTVTVRIDPSSSYYRVDTTGVSGTGLYYDGVLALSNFESLQTDAPRLQFVFQPTGNAFGDSVVVAGSSSAVTIQLDPWSGAAMCATPGYAAWRC